MTEDYLHYLWRYGLFQSGSLRTTTGTEVRILKPGIYNRDAGPDFLQSQIQLGSACWVGHVEIHIKTSDWNKHGHQQDQNYNPVILHVVHEDDRKVYTESGVSPPVMLIQSKPGHYEYYKEMVSSISAIPCGNSWRNASLLKIDAAITAMGVEQMSNKFKWLEKKLEKNLGAWKDLFFQVFARAFGFGKNQENFDFLAQSLPFKLVQKHRQNLFQLEALIFGLSGLIPERPTEAYSRALKSEYYYLSRKYNLIPHREIHWKVMKTRPQNNPVRRLAQMAAWLHQSVDLWDFILALDVSRAPQHEDVLVSPYWKIHVDFDRLLTGEAPRMGVGAADLLHINAFWPLRSFYYSKQSGVNHLSDWVDSLEGLRPENNYIIKQWKEAGFLISNAFDSQTFLYLYKNYCSSRKCIQCQLGQVILQM